jgi:hypothetical protein
MDGLIRHLDMQGIPIRIRIDRNGGNAHAARGFDHAAGNLAAIRDQDFLEHRVSTQEMRSGVLRIKSRNAQLG